MKACVWSETAEQAAIHAARECGIGGQNNLKPRTLLKRAKRILAQPQVKQAIMDTYELEGLGGFSLTEALNLHVKHIRGFQAEDGEYVKPSLQALSMYLKIVLPDTPRRIQHSGLINHVPGARPRDEARIGAPGAMAEAPAIEAAFIEAPKGPLAEVKREEDVDA